MSGGADFCRALQRAHARLRLKADDELGRRHGIDLVDFMLLDTLARAPAGRVALAELTAPAGLPRSGVLRRLMALEKVGLVERAGDAGRREIAVRPGGRALAGAAAGTLDWIGEAAADALAPIDAGPWARGLTALAGAPALALF